MQVLFDNPILRFCSKLLDLVILNAITLICCIPIITIGAAITAANFTALKVRRNEGYVIRNFFRSFKENFKQSTLIWLMLVVHVGVAVVAWIFARNMGGTLSTVLLGIIAVLLIFTILACVWIFPLQSKFVNPIRITIKNAFLLAFKCLFKTLTMIAMYSIPIMLMWIIPTKWYVAFLLLVGVSAPVYWCVMTYDKLFEDLERGVRDVCGEDEGCDI